MIWVVEMLEGENWNPTVGVALSRREGRIELLRWQDDNPDSTFRLVKYERGTR